MRKKEQKNTFFYQRWFFTLVFFVGMLGVTPVNAKELISADGDLQIEANAESSLLIEDRSEQYDEILKQQGCIPDGGTMWVNGSEDPDISSQAQQEMAKIGISSTVLARSYGEVDSCGTYEHHGLDFTITLPQQVLTNQSVRQTVINKILPILTELGKPSLGKVELIDSLGKIYPVSTVDALNSVLTPGPAGDPPPDALFKKVYVIVYDPLLNNGKKLSEEAHWNDHSAITQQTIDFFKQASSDKLNYTVVDTTIVTSGWPELADGFVYTEATYMAVLSGQQTAHYPWAVNYNKIVNTPAFDICGKVNRGEIDEVWIYNGPWFGFYESTLVGPGSYFYNSLPVSGSHGCNRVIPIMGPSVQRTVDESVHNFTHRTEDTMKKVYGSWLQNNTSHSWNKFALIRAQSPNYSYSGCGSGHYPPNGTSDYNYANTSSVMSNCDDFFNYPSLGDPLQVAQPITCSNWGCSSVGYYNYWYSHFPSASGCGPDNVANDWWNYIANPAIALYPPNACQPDMRIISGNVGIGGVSLTYTDGIQKTVSTDNYGNYFLMVSNHWSGDIVPFKDGGYLFSPASRSYIDIQSDTYNQGYTSSLIAPEISVQGNGVTINDEDNLPSLTDYTEFGSVPVAGGSISHIFIIQNTGGGNLNLTGSPKVTISGAHASNFSVTAQPSSPVAAASSTTFSIVFDPDATGMRTATISIASNDTNENPYNFSIRGMGGDYPEMEVLGNNVVIFDGDNVPSTSDHTDFGKVVLASGPVSRTFTISNIVGGDLNLTGSPKVAISGTHAGDFSVTVQPSSPIVQSASTTFTIAFNPGGSGLRTASVSIDNEDANENPYNFSIQGTGFNRYYVNASTGDNAGSCTTVVAPCRNIQEAVNKAGAGETVYVASGTYLFSTNNTPNVVIINKSLTLSGGWNSDFTAQNGASTIDGANTNNGILSASGTVLVENFVIKNSRSSNSGAIYIVSGNFTLKKSTLKGNVATGNGAGIFLDNGALTVVNSTISGNTANGFGGGIYASINTFASVVIQNSTIAYNSASTGGGISRANGTYNISNTIIANNNATLSNPDCNGTIATANYSIIENPTGCVVTNGANNINADPKIDSALTGDALVHVLLNGSLAINAGTVSGCPSTDQVGTTRPQGDVCDIGSIEYLGNGMKPLNKLSGSNQESAVNTAFALGLSVLVLDVNDIPVNGVNVTFTAPDTGARGAFSASGTNITTVVTGIDGIATTSTFTANGTPGSYAVTASASGYDSVDFQLTNLPASSTRYVTPTGSDESPTTCNSPAAPCLTLHKAIASAIAGDNIYVAEGLYLVTGLPVELNKNITILGGWNAAFTSQTGFSTLDGNGSTGTLVQIKKNAVIERFIFKNRSLGIDISDGETCPISAAVTLRQSSITGMIGEGGLRNCGTLSIINSTIGNNQGIAGAIDNDFGTLTIQNTTITKNTSTNGQFGAGGINNNSGTVSIKNSIVTDNVGMMAECSGVITSAGYNILGSIIACDITTQTTDQIEVDPRLGQLSSLGYYSLLVYSPAINAGNDAVCPSIDQLGTTRPRGTHCDIGAIESVEPPFVGWVSRTLPEYTDAASVEFSVIFTEPVTNVDKNDFILTTTGVTGTSVTNVTGSGSTYIVTVNTGSGNGTIRLDVKADGGIVDNDSYPIELPYAEGQTYTIVKTGNIPISPAKDSYIATATPTFTWKAVTGALEYHLQVDKLGVYAEFGDIDHYQSSGTSYTSPSLDYGVHYWRMRVRTADDWGPWSPAWKFTLTPPLPATPTLVNPANAALLPDNTPDLTWNMAVEDDRYELQIDNLSTFASPEQTFSASTGVLTYTATTLPDGIWYWRVRTINYLNAPSAWSTYRSFTVDMTGPVAPVLSAPANAASIISTPAFSWAAAATATKYQFEYDNDSDFSSPIYTSIDLTTTSHTPPAIALGAYSWHVRGKDAAGNWGTWSTARTVTILPAVPVAPTLLTPAVSAVINDSTPDFAWNSVVSGNTYELEISNASTFATKQQTFAGGVGVLAYTATNIPDGMWYWHVRALNVNGVAGAWSAYRSFTVDTTGPVAPVLSAPANAASVIGTPAFSWTAATTATKYQFEYDNDADFSSPIYTSVDITTTSHTPPAMALGTYSWRVRGKDAAGNWGAWSAPRTITILPLVPVAPVLVNPAASAVTSDSTPDFTWNSVVSGNTYQLEISNASTFAIKQQTFTGGVGVLNYTATNIPDGVWYWHVRALNVNGVAGAWSAHRSFTVDTTGPVATTLSAPANAASVIGTPAFSWAAAATATKYQFEYDNDADFSSPTYTSIDLTTTSHTPPAIALGAYSWHVRGKDAAGNWGAWSIARTIAILPLVPVAPTLATPVASAVTSDSTPDFAWNSVVSGNTYQLEISNASTFATKQQTFTGGVGVLTYTATTIPDGVWYWHVRALNVNGVAGTWSAYRSFTVDTTGPIAPTLNAPANAASVIGTPAFSWAAAATATKYQFEYDNDADFSSPTYTSIDLTTTSHTPPAMALGTYSWHVRGKDAAGNWGAWSAARTVTILPLVPVAPTLATPAASAVTNDSTPDFTWNSVVSGNTYQLEISNASTFATKQQTFAGGVGVLIYTATTIPDGVWYWHVRALNVNSVAGAWSAYRSFTVDTTGPVAPTLSAPANAASVIGTPAFSWTAAATATKYQFEYDNDADFSSPTYTSIDLTTTSHTPPAIALGTYSWHVRGKDAAGNWGAWSTTRTVTILPAVPVAPTLVTPAASAVTNDSTPDFTWNSVVSGNTYELEISNASTFATKQQTFAGGVGVLNYTATTIPDGVWYWHVRALNVNSVAGAWSAYRSFIVDTTGPVAPTLSAPANAASVIGTPAFSWAAATTATKYQFEYDNDADFSSPTYTSIDLTTTSHTPPAIALGAYSWHVRGKDAAGNWGAWSTARTVTILPAVPVAPTLATPAASAVTNDSTPDFAWNSVVSGNTYELEISNASTFATKQQTFASGVGVLTYTATTLPDGVWYWHVRALNVNGVAGAWSAYRSFTVDTTGPVAPTLTAPANAVSVNGTPAFSWAAAATATKYQFEYDNDADFSSPIYTSADLTTTSHTPLAMAIGTYSWHVRGKDAAGNWGAWSTTRIVSIIPLVPVSPTLTSPANGSISQNPAPALNWTAMPNAASYQVQMDNNSTFSSPEFDGNSATNTITPTSLADGIYYWRVRQTNILGGTSLWSTAWRVTISQPIPAVPNGNSLRSLELPTSDTGLPTFNWSSVEYGMTYQLQVADNESFTNPIFDDTAEITERTLTEPLVIGEYFWRVRAINEYGTAGPWSETWTITVDIPPATPTQLLPSESTVSLNGEASFSWQDAENAEKYQIQVDNAEDFSSPEFDDTAIQATRELLKPLTDGTYFWRVRGLNIYDTAGEWSDVRSFTVSIPPAAPTLLTPEADSTDETGFPAFEWEAVLNGVTYQLQVDNNADFSSPEFDDTAETTTRELAMPLENGIYYWRVRTLKADDTFGEWSLVWSFTVNVP